MALTAIAVEKAQPKEKLYKLMDEGGLYLEVPPKGSKRWRLRYWLNKKENRISLGVYPQVKLSDARTRRDEAKVLIAKGIDPSAERQQEKVENSSEHSFENIAREWASKFSHKWTEGHAELTLRRLELNIFPYLGEKPIGSITAPELLAALRRIEARGALEVCRRVRGICSMIFRYAIATGRAERDPAADLQGAFAAPAKKHHPAITDPKAVGQLLRDIDNCKASFVVYCALRLAPLVFVRPGGTPSRRMVRVQPGSGGMAYSRREDKNADAAHCSAFRTGYCYNQRTEASHGQRRRQIPVPVYSHHFPCHVGKHDQCRITAHWIRF